MNLPDLETALYKALCDEDDEWGDTRLHVSDLAVAIPMPDGKCPRQLWMRLRGYPQVEPHIGKLLMFDHGHRLHERLPELLRIGLEGTGWSVEHVELKLDDLLPDEVDGGTMDLGLIGPNGERIVLDWKTVRGRTFQYLEAPKPSNVLQVQTYMKAWDADLGLIAYVDREGQNGLKAFPVERDDEAVEFAAGVARGIADQEECPPKLLPTINRKHLKGPDSIYLNEPWQCRYCEFRDLSCDGALLPTHRDLRVVAKVDDGGRITFQTEDPVVMDLVSTLLNETQETAA